MSSQDKVLTASGLVGVGRDGAEPGIRHGTGAALPHGRLDGPQEDLQQAAGDLGLLTQSQHTRLGTDSTHWRNGTRGSTWSVMWAAVSTMRRVAQEGKMSRPLQQNATRKSCRQEAQYTRANP